MSVIRLVKMWNYRICPSQGFGLQRNPHTVTYFDKVVDTWKCLLFCIFFVDSCVVEVSMPDFPLTPTSTGVSNHWTGIWNGTINVRSYS